MKNIIPLVSVVCTTYNHELYIAQALDGFVMQQCNFPIEVIVHDDASTDNTVEIIKEYAKKYPDLIRPILQTENQYSKGFNIWGYLFTEEARGKYIALCEGDDYWTDSNKLQKQVDFLEENPEYGMSYSKAIYSTKKGRNQKNNFGKNYLSFENLLMNNVIPTLTTVFRKNLYFQYAIEIKPEEKQWLLGDYPLWLWIAKNNKLFYMDFVVGVYRILPESASHSVNPEKNEKFIRSVINVKEFFVKHYHVNDINVLQEIKFTKTWWLFRLACKFSINYLFDDVKQNLKYIQIKKIHVLYIKTVLFFEKFKFFC